MLKRRLLLYITFAGFLVGCNKVYPPKGAIYSESPPERIKQIDAVIRPVFNAEIAVFMTADIGLQAFATKYYDGTFSIHLSKGLLMFSKDLIATVLAHEYCHIILNHHEKESYWGRHEGEEREADKCGIEIAKVAGFDACTLCIVEPSNEGRTKQIEELCK